MIDKDNASILLRAWLLGTFYVEYRREDGRWETIEKAKWERSYARPLFKRLLCSRGRKAQRGTLCDDLWPNPENPELVERYLNDAAYQLRKILSIPDVLKTLGKASGYELANQAQLWCDIDACEAFMKEAELIGYTSIAALPLLEQANSYFERGEFLEGEGGLWIYARKGTLERMHYRCQLWLAESYEQQAMVGQAEMQYSRLLEDNPSDEDVLCRLMRLYHQQGMTHLALRCYEEAKRQAREAGQKLSSTMHTFAQRLLNEPHHDEVFLRERKPQTPAHSFEEDGRQVIPTIPSAIVQNSLKEMYLLGDQDIHTIVNRREFFQEGLRTGATILTSYNLMNNELLDRFLRALKKPSTIDERILNYFELRTDSYWRDRHSAALASGDLLSYVLEHFQKIITLLEGALFPSIRTRLCCIASGIAQLAGHLFFDMGEFARARSFHQVAVTAAREGEDRALEAVAWGRISFTWTYSGNLREALRCIQEAHRLAEGNVNTKVRAYLAAVEAEIQAVLGDSETCFKALDIAEHVEDRQYPKEELYWLRFDRSRFVGYQGICFKRLYHPADVRTRSFLDKAQKALTDALTLLDPAKIQRRPALLIDIASTYAQQGDVEGACEYAIQSLSILAQTQSKTVAKRLFSLRQELERWKDTRHIQYLDQQITSLIKSERTEKLYE